MIAFDVLGTPAPKGSGRAFINKKTGRAFVAPGGAKSTEVKIANWNSAIRERARRVVGEVMAPPFVDQALVVFIVFRLARPAGHWATGKHAGQLKASAPSHPRSKPDIDKLARSTLDAMTGIVFDDDSRIARLVLEKQYARPGEEGAHVSVESMALADIALDKNGDISSSAAGRTAA